MGGFSSSNPLVRIGASALDAYTGVPVASAVLGASEAAEWQKSQAAQQQNYDLQSAALLRQQQQQVRERQNLLKRTLASQRARLSAMGVGGGGSADALVAGLSQQAATDIADLEGGTADQLAAVNLRRAQNQGGTASVWSSLLTPVIQSVSSPTQSRDADTIKGISFL